MRISVDRRVSALALLSGSVVAVASMAAGAAPTFTVGANFTGSTLGLQSGFIPPDTNGAVGPGHVVELINGRFRVYDKNNPPPGGPAFVQSKTFQNFWIDAGVTPTGNAFDPRVLFDRASNRWYAVGADNGGAANNYLLAVSDTSDPTGHWTGRKIDSDTDNSHWLDFPMLGINNNSVTLSGNAFSIPAGGSTKTNVLVLNKANLLAGSVTGTHFQDIDPNGTGFTPQPIVSLDNSSTRLMLSDYNKPAGFIKVTEITGATAETAGLDTVNGFVAVTARASSPTADQPGPKNNFDTGGTRFSGSVVQIGNSVWGVHNAVNVGGNSALEWYELDATTFAIKQSGLVTGAVISATTDIARGSISVNSFGDVVIGFSISNNETLFGSAGFVVGETIAGVTTFTDPQIYKMGVADYQRLDGSGRNRWGDYSATTFDPLNERSFWTVQEFVSATDIWSVQWAQINIPTPGAGVLVLAGVVAMGRRRR